MIVGALDANTTVIHDEDLQIMDDPIHCKIAKEDRRHLFHKAGFITRLFRDNLIFPLAGRLNARDKADLERENWISTDLFWNSPVPDLRFPRQQEIREHFRRYDRYIVINEGGKEIKLRCRVLEPKNCDPSECLNHLIVQGNTSTFNNNIPGLYPFLDSYLKGKEQDPTSPPGRFIILNHYHHTIKEKPNSIERAYLPGDMDEWTFVFKKAVESIVNTYGQLELLTGHSLGTVPVVGFLQHLSDKEFCRLFPKTLFLSQGPSSSYEVTKNVPFENYPWGWYFFGLGALLYYTTKWLGWEVKLDYTLVNRLKNLSNSPEVEEKLKNTNIIISEVLWDYYFPGAASLASSSLFEEINDRVNLYRLTFNPPLSVAVKRNHHNYNLGFLQRRDLMRERLHFRGQKTLHLDTPEQIVRYEGDHPYIIRHGESLVDVVLRSLKHQQNAIENAYSNLKDRVEHLQVVGA